MNFLKWFTTFEIANSLFLSLWTEHPLSLSLSLSLSVCVYETITIYLLHNNTLSERSLSHVNLRLPYHQKPNTLSRTITFILSLSLTLSLSLGG